MLEEGKTLQKISEKRSKKSKKSENLEKKQSNKNKRQKTTEKADEAVEVKETTDRSRSAIMLRNQREDEELERRKKDSTPGPDMAPGGICIPEVNVDEYPDGDEGAAYIRKYARAVGFVIKIEKSWTGFKRCIWNRNARQLLYEEKNTSGQKKNCPWLAILKRDHDKYWRFKKIFNYHNHPFNGATEKPVETTESLKSIPKEIQTKINKCYFDLGKPAKDIVIEFKNMSISEKNQSPSPESLKTSWGGNDKENSKQKEPQKKKESQKIISVSVLNTYLGSFLYPKEDDYFLFCKSLSTNSSGANQVTFSAVNQETGSWLFSYCKPELLSLYWDIVYIDSDYNPSAGKIPGHKVMINFIGINEHGSLVPLFTNITKKRTIKGYLWAFNEIFNNWMKGKKPKLFITDMDPDLILALMKTFKVKNDSQLNLIYDAFQVNKRLFNLFFMINSSKYKSGEICREFLQGCISENKEDYLNAINKLYRIYAMIYPKIRQTLHVLMKNRDKIAHAHFGQFKFIKERFSEKARILWNIIRRAPMRKPSYKQLSQTIPYILATVKQHELAVDFMDYVESSMNNKIVEGQKRQFKYSWSPFWSSILDDIIKTSAEIWRCEDYELNQYKCLKLEWLTEDKDRISKYNTTQEYENPAGNILTVKKDSIRCNWKGRYTIPNLPCVHIVSLFIFKKVNIKQYIHFLSGTRWDNTRSDVGRKRKYAEKIPFYINPSDPNKADEEVDETVFNIETT